MLKRLTALAVIAIALASCGGGSGSSGSSGGGTTVSTGLTVTLSSNSGSVTATEGATSVSLNTVATVTGTVSTPIVVDLQYDAAVFSSVTAVSGSTLGSYTVSAQTLPDLADGTYTGNITLRLCQETACTHVYTGTIVTYAYNVVVNLQDWSTFQRNPAHTGYVHTTLNPSVFADAWQWTLPVHGNKTDSINSVATGDGMVFVTKDDYLGIGKVYGLNETDGTIAWQYDLGVMEAVGPPAFANHRVYVNTVGQYHAGETYEFDAATGRLLGSYVFYVSGGKDNLIAPTVTKTTLWTTSIAQDPRQILAVFDVALITGWSLNGDGASITGAATGGSAVSQAVAVDGQSVYYYSTPSWENYETYLDVYDVSTLNHKALIKDTYAPFSPPSIAGNLNDDGYYGAPIIADSQTVLAYSGATYSAQHFSSAEPLGARYLSSYNRSTNTLGWGSSKQYLTTPAVAKGIAYLARNNPALMEAIDVTTGAVLWSWAPPAGDSEFHRNTIVTDNLVFVSTDKNIYAIDLKTHLKVWSYGAAGTLAISSGYRLYIMTGTSRSDGHMIAIKLK